MQSVIIGRNQAGQRLDKFLRKFLREAGDGFLYKMLRKKNITLNDKKATGSELLAQGDRVTFFFSPETYAKMTGIPMGGNTPTEAGKGKAADDPEARAAAEYVRAYRTLSDAGILVLYEDDDILALCKPAGILSQKAKTTDISLNEWLVGYLLEKRALPPEELRTFKPSVCNRLDRNTSGIVLCGKSLWGSQYLTGHIRDKSIRKLYRTICVGELDREIRLCGYLKKDETRNKVTLAGITADGRDTADKERDTVRGQSGYIETVCRPLRVSGGYTLLEVELITGKTHQIRAHLAGIGHPLIGDHKYGDSRTNHFFRERYGLRCQLLHAWRTELPKAPGENSGTVICAPYPKAFTDIIRELNLSED